MRTLVLLPVLLGACGAGADYTVPTPESDGPTWADDGWEAGDARYFRTTGEIEPDPEGGDDWTGHERWTIEDGAGGVICQITWRTDGGLGDPSGCPGCDTAWDILCHSGVQGGDRCDEWFDPATVTMSAELELGYDPDQQAVYMRSSGYDTWDYVAQGRVEGEKLIYDERWDLYY